MFLYDFGIEVICHGKSRQQYAHIYAIAFHIVKKTSGIIVSLKSRQIIRKLFPLSSTRHVTLLFSLLLNGLTGLAGSEPLGMRMCLHYEPTKLHSSPLNP